MCLLQKLAERILEMYDDFRGIVKWCLGLVFHGCGRGMCRRRRRISSKCRGKYERLRYTDIQHDQSEN